MSVGEAGHGLFFVFEALEHLSSGKVMKTGLAELVVEVADGDAVRHRVHASTATLRRDGGLDLRRGLRVESDDGHQLEANAGRLRQGSWDLEAWGNVVLIDPTGDRSATAAGRFRLDRSGKLSKLAWGGRY